MTDDPDEAYRARARALLEGLESAIEPWIVRSVMRRAPEDWDDARLATLQAEAERVASQSRAQIVPVLRVLFETDVDRQATNPLEVLREHLGPANRVLADAGVPPPARDPFIAERLPEDVYALSPANFGDVDQRLGDLGLEWGAAKAHLVISRHRSS